MSKGITPGDGTYKRLYEEDIAKGKFLRSSGLYKVTKILSNTNDRQMDELDGTIRGIYNYEFNKIKKIQETIDEITEKINEHKTNSDEWAEIFQLVNELEKEKLRKNNALDALQNEIAIKINEAIHKNTNSNNPIISKIKYYFRKFQNFISSKKEKPEDISTLRKLIKAESKFMECKLKKAPNTPKSELNSSLKNN